MSGTQRLLDASHGFRHEVAIGVVRLDRATCSGEIQPRHESKLGFQTSGKIVARLVELDAQVKRGQVLMRLAPAQERLRVAAAVADMDAARCRVAQSRIDLQRTEQLLARQFASQARWTSSAWRWSSPKRS